MSTIAEPAIGGEVWDLSSYFSGLDTDEFRQFRDALERDIPALAERAATLGALTTENARDWVAVYAEVEQLMMRLSHIGSYVGCLCSTNSKDDAALEQQARLSVLRAEFEKLHVIQLCALRGCGEAAFEALAQASELTGARFMLERQRAESRHLMSQELEMLAADLGVDGIEGWGRLYDKLAGSLEFNLQLPDGTTKQTPMAQRRGLLDSPDPAIRRSALVDGNAAWETVADACAAALNHISGTRLTLYRKRGIDHFLDQAIFDANITRRTLDAMYAAISESFPMVREILRRKQKALGLSRMGFQDIAAPLPLKSDAVFTWDQAKAMTLDAFSDYPKLQGFCEEFFANRHVESEQRKNKRPGAFCTSSLLRRQSRVYMTYNGTLGDITTLAHELGHAFHNYLMRDLRPYARRYPMTLAETASIFAEGLMGHYLATSPKSTPEMKAAVLNHEMSDAVILLLDISMRFYFERSLYEERAKGELSVAKLKELMLAAQEATFGDAIDSEQRDPLFWASKLHFYITGVSFYNYPYTFGHLFARGLMAEYRRRGRDFFAQYEAILLQTGSAMAETVVQDALNVDIELPDFWRAAIRTHEEAIPEFVKALQQVGLSV